MTPPSPVSPRADADPALAEGATSTPGAAAAAARPRIVIAGAGPVGIRAAQELCRKGLDSTVINAERWLPYNRIKLTPLLAGDAQLGQIMQPWVFNGPGRVSLFSGQSIVEIDRQKHLARSSTGRVFPYDKLILALGSRAHVPPIPGRALDGVFTFRDASDVEQLIARSFRARVAVVIGGGLLGLEAARGMARRGCTTWVIEHGAHLMPRQLDAMAGEFLAEEVEASGLHLRLASKLDHIYGGERVEGVMLGDGSHIACDTVIICTGIRSNIELARAAGLSVGHGITVNERMMTDDPDIYAIGECAEFAGVTAGLVGPGFEQARVAVANIAGEQSRYRAIPPSTRLKLVGTDVFSMGDVEQLGQRSDVKTLAFSRETDWIYRTLVLKGWRVVGAISIGPWPEVNQAQQAIRDQTLIWPWQLLRFWLVGRIWRDAEADDVRNWPETSTVCNCTGVTRGQITTAIGLGAGTVERLQRDTGAATVCGTCKPALATLLGGQSPREPIPWWRTAFALAAGAAALTIGTLAAPVWPFADVIGDVGAAELLWLDPVIKQISGFTLLGIAALAGLLSVRKRFLPAAAAQRAGNYAIWRLVHIAIGAAGLIALFAHTGFRLGHNLNFWLIAAFLACLASGSAIGIASALEHRMMQSAVAALRLKRRMFWLHVGLLWPLPLLLGFHILSVYYF